MQLDLKGFPRGKKWNGSLGLTWAWGLAMGAVVCACGGAEIQDEPPACQVALEPVDAAPPTGSTVRTYSTLLPEVCSAFVSKNETPLTVTIAGDKPGGSAAYLARLAAGTRDYPMGPTYSLRQGSVYVDFRSDANPQWALPWKDSPPSINLEVRSDSSLPSDAWPRKFTVSLSRSNAS